MISGTTSIPYQLKRNVRRNKFLVFIPLHSKVSHPSCSAPWRTTATAIPYQEKLVDSISVMCPTTQNNAPDIIIIAHGQDCPPAPCLGRTPRPPTQPGGQSSSACTTRYPRPGNEGEISKVVTTFVKDPRPESGLDCLMCATFARQRLLQSRALSFAPGWYLTAVERTRHI